MDRPGPRRDPASERSASLTGTGTTTIAGPNQVTATAHLVATNFDALMERLQAHPELAQAIPVLALAKGIGKTINNTLVWDVTVQNNRVLVNGVDLQKMAGGK